MIPWFKPHFWGKEKAYILDALDSTWISGGAYVDRLERDLADHLGVRHCVTTSNGTAALHLALLATSLGAGDEIIVPGFGYAAAANMVKAIGARPVFADVDVTSWCITADTVKACLSDRTRGIIPIHTYGGMCDMEAITRLARNHKLIVIEDAAECLFSKWKNGYAGTFGDMGSFSFQATKTITTGEGGALVMHDDSLAERAKLFRNHGVRERRYWHEVPGHNFRLTNMQAALGCAQLEARESIIAQKKRVYRSYQLRLQDQRGITLQYIHGAVDAVMWAVAVRLEESAFSHDRDGIIAALLEKNIEARPGFYSFGDMPLYHAPNTPVADAISRSIISLPSYASITDDDIAYVCAQLLALRT